MVEIVATADLHYGLHPEGDERTAELAHEVCRRGGDALVIAGDVAGRDLARTAECFSLFAGFPGKRLFVAGNHDLWCPPHDSLTRYRKLLPAIGREFGFHSLDVEAAWVGDVAIVGTVAWYDYGFRDASLSVDPRCYRAKSWPGVMSWNDRTFIQWDIDDEGFTRICLQALASQMDAVREGARAIVAVLHHIPFEELLVRRPDDRAWAFGNAFLGSPRFGDLLAAEPKVRAVVCGHTHAAADIRVGAIRVVNVGSTYREKRFVVVEA